MIDLREWAKKYDYKREETNRLFNVVGPSIAKRGYLTSQDFLEICNWKASRARRHFSKNNDESIVKEITRLALSIQDDEYKIRVLSSLKGVNVPMASAILAICYPRKYGIIDVRAWGSLHKMRGVKKKNIFTTSDYKEYLDIIRSLAKKEKLTPREVDKALFTYDKSKKI